LDAIAASDAANPPLRAYIAVNREDVLQQAAAATKRFSTGAPLSILDGIPVAVKDELDMVPYPTTAGTAFLGRHPASSDATVVARLRAAGALLIGKANMHEIGMGVTGLNPIYGTPRNPYATHCHTGGSSSGSAAAVAAGLCPLALAADGGGSIRIPAALCGVVGLKPTYGRVSEHGALPPCAGAWATSGRSVPRRRMSRSVTRRRPALMQETATRSTSPRLRSTAGTMRICKA
jgi:Asp-tRNA(Asn)/Glu-tRNA(Gln) amidotransferase A subunit family amidase